MSNEFEIIGENDEAVAPPPDTPEEIADREALRPLMEKYEADMQALPHGKDWTVLCSHKPLGASWAVTTIVSAPDGTQIADCLVQFSPDKFFLTWVGVHEDYRGRKISSLLYERISSFLERERPGYAFSSNAINDTTKYLTRKYFEILDQRGKKMRGRVRNPNAPDAAH